MTDLVEQLQKDHDALRLAPQQGCWGGMYCGQGQGAETIDWVRRGTDSSLKELRLSSTWVP